MLLVFLGLRPGGELRSMTHCGVGRRGSCAIPYVLGIVEIATYYGVLSVLYVDFIFSIRHT